MQEHFQFSGDERVDWRLDEHTKTLGKQGIAAARATLQQCAQHQDHLQLAQAA